MEKISAFNGEGSATANRVPKLKANANPHVAMHMSPVPLIHVEAVGSRNAARIPEAAIITEDSKKFTSEASPLNVEDDPVFKGREPSSAFDEEVRLGSFLL